MRILVTGRGTSASWQIRGVQIGNALGASVIPNASAEAIAAHDVVLVVKRVAHDLAERLKRSKRRVVWDCVDFYPQPNTWNRLQLIDQTKAYARAMGAHVLIGATARMADDLGSKHWVPHHGWARGVADVSRPVSVICYEGSARYVEPYQRAIERECARYGWRFVVNPSDYLASGAILALRAPRWGGYAAEHWKSGVKLSNAQIAGLPFIGPRECGYVEQASGAEHFVNSLEDLQSAFRWLETANRAEISEQMRARAPTLQQVAECTRKVLSC